MSSDRQSTSHFRCRVFRPATCNDLEQIAGAAGLCKLDVSNMLALVTRRRRPGFKETPAGQKDVIRPIANHSKGKKSNTRPQKMIAEGKI